MCMYQEPIPDAEMMVSIYCMRNSQDRVWEKHFLFQCSKYSMKCTYKEPVPGAETVSCSCGLPWMSNTWATVWEIVFPPSYYQMLQVVCVWGVKNSLTPRWRHSTSHTILSSNRPETRSWPCRATTWRLSIEGTKFLMASNYPTLQNKSPYTHIPMCREWACQQHAKTSADKWCTLTVVVTATSTFYVHHT